MSYNLKGTIDFLLKQGAENSPVLFKKLKTIEHFYQHSKQATSKGAFIAVKGEKTDGHHYVQSLLKTCPLIFVDKTYPVLDHQKDQIIQVNDTKNLLQSLGPIFYNHPSKCLFLIGITGTNGKTTCAYLIENCFLLQNKPVGVIGTIDAHYKDIKLKLPNTTPNNLDLNRLLFEMLSLGVKVVVMEVSSHALSLNRVNNLHFDIGLFTNLSLDHLDFHQTMQDYLQAKLSLFSLLHQSEKSFKKGVFCLDSFENKEKIKNQLRASSFNYPILFFSKTKGADYHYKIKKTKKYFFSILFEEKVQCSFPINFQIRFNVQNLVGSLLCAFKNLEQVAPMKVANMLENFSVVGRLEKITVFKQASIFIDYAHTPHALKTVLSFLKKEFPFCHLLCLFGCGGNRDPSKRKQMGKVASKYADKIYVTSDNPRLEDPLEIIQMIVQGIDETTPTEVFIDRKQAIKQAILDLTKTDILLLAGKGHETYQMIKNRAIAFNDKKVVFEAINEIDP